MNKVEVWKNISGYEGFYKISNLGNVKSLKRIVNSTSYGHPTSYIKEEKILKPIKLGKYNGVQLSVNGITKKKYIHRLVLESFTNKNTWKETVNHIDGIKKNNNLDNLEWNTYSENNLHASRVLKLGKFRKVVRINPKNKKDIKKYPSIRQAMEDINLKKFDSNISKYCKMKNDRKYKGFIWRYKEDYNYENFR